MSIAATPELSFSSTAAPADTAPTPAETAEAAAPELSGDALLEQIMGDVDLESLDLEALEQFEAGNTESVRRALQQHLPALGNDDTAADPAAGAEADPENEGDDDETTPTPTGEQAKPGSPTGEVAARVSIKHLQPESRTTLISILDLTRQGQSLADAARDVLGLTAPAAAAAAAPVETAHAAPDGATPETAPAVKVPAMERVEQITAQLLALKADYDAKKAVYDPTASDVLEQMQDVKLDLREAQAAVKQQISERQNFQREVLASRERMAVTYADLAQNPQFMDFAEAEITLAENRKDPIMSSPDWPEKIAGRVKAKYFSTQPVAQSAEPAAEVRQPVPPAPKSRVRIPGSPTGEAYAAGAVSAETALSEISKLSSDQIDALLAETERKAMGKPR